MHIRHFLHTVNTSCTTYFKVQTLHPNLRIAVRHDLLSHIIRTLYLAFVAIIYCTRRIYLEVEVGTYSTYSTYSST